MSQVTEGVRYLGFAPTFRLGLTVIVFVAEEEEAEAASVEVVGEGAMVSTKDGTGVRFWSSFL